MHAMPTEIIDFFEILIQISLASTSRPGTSGYMAPEICSNQASTKSDVYSFGVLLIRLVNGSLLTLDGDEIPIRHFIRWVREVQEEEDGFQQIFYEANSNSIVGFDQNEAKSFLQISFQCIKVNLVPNLLFYHSICGQANFKNLKNHGFDVIFETI
jgi:serine/threonine protein kinase